MEKELVLVGGGGHCKSVIEVAESAVYKIKGILDKPELVGKKVLDYLVIGTDEQIIDMVGEALFVVTVGHVKDPSLRVKLHHQVLEAGGQFATLIASSARVSRYALVGEGSVIMHNAIVNAGARIGEGCIINTSANIEHDVTIGNFCHVSTGAMVNGDCIIGEKSFIGSQSVIQNNVSIVKECVIAAGAVVRKDIVKAGIYVGNPANWIKNVN